MLASRILHVVSAIILVGGMFYLWAVVSPAATAASSVEPADEAAVDRFFGGRRAAWAKWVGIVSLLLLATGLWNFISMVTGNWIHWSYHMLGGLKILGGLLLMALAALLAGRTAAANALRRNGRLWLTMALLLGMIIVAMGSVMRTYQRTPKGDAALEPTTIATEVSANE